MGIHGYVNLLSSLPPRQKIRPDLEVLADHSPRYVKELQLTPDIDSPMHKSRENNKEAIYHHTIVKTRDQLFLGQSLAKTNKQTIDVATSVNMLSLLEFL